MSDELGGKEGLGLEAGVFSLGWFPVQSGGPMDESQEMDWCYWFCLGPVVFKVLCFWLIVR